METLVVSRIRSGKMRFSMLICVVFSLLILVFISNYILPSVYAQEASTWMPPLPISRGILDDAGRPIDSIAPTLVVDSTGIVHAFWATIQTHETGSYLYYARWDGTTWSPPLDILYSSSGNYQLPQAAIDQDDQIHLVWVSGGLLLYSQTATTETISARTMSEPIRVIDELATNASIAVAPDGNIHIVYTTTDVGRNITHTVFHIWSPDGETWFSPIEIGIVRSEINHVVPRLDIDERNRIHIVFGENGAGDAVYYSRSSDNGKSWSKLLTIASRDERYFGTYGPAWINVFAIGRDEIHIVWDGIPAGQRWHQWSDDGGETWKPQVQISPELVGLTGTNAMGVDSTGRLHLFTMGPAYASWWNGTWSSLDPILRQGWDWDGEGPALAVNGNQIVIAWWNREPDAIEIWSSSAQIDTPTKMQNLQVSEITRPTSTSTPTPQPTQSLGTNDLNTSSIELGKNQFENQPYQGKPWFSIFAGVLSTIGFIAILIIIHAKRKSLG